MVQRLKAQFLVDLDCIIASNADIDIFGNDFTGPCTCHESSTSERRISQPPWLSFCLGNEESLTETAVLYSRVVSKAQNYSQLSVFSNQTADDEITSLPRHEESDSISLLEAGLLASGFRLLDVEEVRKLSMSNFGTASLSLGSTTYHAALKSVARGLMESPSKSLVAISDTRLSSRNHTVICGCDSDLLLLAFKDDEKNS